jgi:hypothetical protein
VEMGEGDVEIKRVLRWELLHFKCRFLKTAI